MTTRNDGYGGEVVPGRNFTIDRVLLTFQSIKRLSIDYPINSEIILIEYNPPPDKERLKELVKGYGVRIITLKPELHDALLEDNKPIVVPFYEYIAKDVGIRHATYETVIACNPDNIFPSFGFDTVLHDLKRGIVRAFRFEVERDFIKQDFDLLISSANSRTLPFFSISLSAAGDFAGFSKAQYEKIGRYPMLHGGWGIDCALFHIAHSKSINSNMRYWHYHVHHDNSFVEVRYPIDYNRYKQINPDIVNTLDEYILEDIIVP